MKDDLLIGDIWDTLWPIRLIYVICLLLACIPLILVILKIPF